MNCSLIDVGRFGEITVKVEYFLFSEGDLLRGRKPRRTGGFALCETSGLTAGTMLELYALHDYFNKK